VTCFRARASLLLAAPARTDLPLPVACALLALRAAAAAASSASRKSERSEGKRKPPPGPRALFVSPDCFPAGRTLSRRLRVAGMASAHLVLDACDFCRNTTAAAAALLSQAPFHSVWPSADGPVPSGSAAGMQPNHALLADPLLIAPAAPPDDADPALYGAVTTVRSRIMATRVWDEPDHTRVEHYHRFAGSPPRRRLVRRKVGTGNSTACCRTPELLRARESLTFRVPPRVDSNSTSRRLPIGTALSSDRCRKRITELTTAIKEDEDHYRVPAFSADYASPCRCVSVDASRDAAYRAAGQDLLRLIVTVTACEIADIKRGKLDAVLTGKVASADREANCQSIVSKPPVATCRAGAVPSAAEDDNGFRSPQSKTGSDEAVGADELCDGRIEVEGTRPTTPTSGASPQFPVPVVAQDDFDGQAGILPGTEFAVQAAANGRVEPQRASAAMRRTVGLLGVSFGAATRKTARRHNEAVDIAQNLSPKASEESRLEPQRQSYAAQAANPPALNLEVDADVTVAPSEDAGGGCGDDQIGPGTKRDMGSAVMEPSVVVTRDVLGNGPDASESAENHDSAAFLTASAPCPHVVAAEDQEHGNGVDGAPIQLKRLSDGGKSTSPASKKVRDSGLGAPCSFATLPLCHDTAPRGPKRLSGGAAGPRAAASDGPTSAAGIAPVLDAAVVAQRRARFGPTIVVVVVRPRRRAEQAPSSGPAAVSAVAGRPRRGLERDRLAAGGRSLFAAVEEAGELGVLPFRRDVLLVCANAIMFDPDCREARKLFDFAEKSLSPPDGSTVARRSESPSSSYSIAEAAAAVPPDKRLTLLPSWRATAPLRPNGGVGTAA
ncbi:MAG: hypothetical protein BJ554DRAFT_5551, partial [Olpidium bornovanus]